MPRPRRHPHIRVSAAKRGLDAPRGGRTFLRRPLPFRYFRRIVLRMTRERFISSARAAPRALPTRGLLLLTRF